MIHNIYVLNDGVYTVEMTTSTHNSTLQLSRDQTPLNAVTIEDFNLNTSFDEIIDTLLFNYGINEMWDYC